MAKKYTLQDFVEKATQVHGDKYDYSKVEYIDSATKVCIICPIHGEFWQQPREHIRGQGCPTCSYRGHSTNGAYTNKEFIEKAKKIHGDKYDYSKVEYKNNSTKVCIICPNHGEFWQNPNKHIFGQGCPSCSGKLKKTTEMFIEEANKVHSNIYDYSQTKYTNNSTKVCIICKEHGEFWQNPKAHLNGCGCPKCKASHLENEMRLFLKENNIEFVEQFKTEFLGQLSLDFYLPQYNVGIECQGEQHFKGWDSKEASLEAITKRDKIKYQLCNDNGIKLLYYSNLGIEYPYQVYENKEELLSEIKSL